MTHCTRCGQPFELRRANDYHCSRCTVEVAALIAPKPRPSWMPTWRRAAIGKSMLGLPVR